MEQQDYIEELAAQLEDHDKLSIQMDDDSNTVLQIVNVFFNGEEVVVIVSP